MTEDEKRKKLLALIPNGLTVGRFVLTVGLLGMILYAPKVENISRWMFWAFVLFVITGLTDAVDGKLARMFEVTSRFGRTMDPLADKILICGSFICFAIIGRPLFFPDHLSAVVNNVIIWTTAFIVVFRETVVQYLRQSAEAKGIQFGANIWGKLKMFIQTFAIGTCIIKMGFVPRALWASWFTTVVFVLMLVATVMSGLRYFTKKKARKAALGF